MNKNTLTYVFGSGRTRKIKESNYKDTDKIFEEPNNFDLKISKWNQYSPFEVADLIKNV